MDRAFWMNRSAENQIGFHRNGVNPLLPRLWAGVSSAPAGRFLVRRCRTSADLHWQPEQGHDVVGVELSLIAGKSVAAEQGIVLAETHEPPFTVLRGKAITVYVGACFDFTPTIGGEFELFYDRAALIALPPEMRPAY